MKTLIWIAAILIVLTVVVVAGGQRLLAGPDRPPEPPEQGTVSLPFGAIDVDEMWTERISEVERSLAESFREEAPEEFDADGDGLRTYELLACSGGGSNGAFGAGFLCGWTAAGTRPDFKIVTGVSTGSLMAVLVYVGPNYDDELKEVFTAYAGEEVIAKRGALAGLFSDGTYDTAPLKGLIDKYVDDDFMAAVAAKHHAGHRLYIGTTNLDTGEFVIWDMGEIAESGRPEAKDQFRNVLLASCAVPVLFPPVYFAVESDGNTYYEMHVDGSAFAQVFFRGFLIEFEDATEDLDLIQGPEVELYVIRNGTIREPDTRRNVGPRAVSIASRTIESLFDITLDASLFRMWVLAVRYGIGFNFVAIPSDAGVELDPITFGGEAALQLFDLGYEMAQQEDPWLDHPPTLDPDELLHGEALASP
jgi:hypothetical protein